LPDWARDIVLSCCKFADGSEYVLRIAVVMPDHVHLVIEPLVDLVRKEVFSLSRILRNIKGVSAREINKKLGRTRAVWQDESFDHVVRDSENLDEKIRYILQNPLRKGLAAKSGEYRWVFLADNLKHMME
jgi:REP element-mobilizing transposase RayT